MTRTAALDDRALDRLLRKQQFVVSRAQAAECGLTPSALKHRLRPGGPWQRLLPGVYATVTGTPTPAQREIAALLYAGPGSVITGFAALRRHGLRVPDSPRIAILVPAGRSRTNTAFVSARPTSRMPDRVCYDGAVQFTLPPRAVADATRELTSFRDVRALVADSVQQGRCRIDWLSGELRDGPLRHSAWFRRALAEVADGIRSAAEADLRDLIIKARLPVPMFNARLYAGPVLLAVVDAWWPGAGVAAEVDSREWHLAPDDWEHTLARGRRLSAHGIIVLRITPGQLRTQPADVVADIRRVLHGGHAPARPAVRALPAAG
jgi:very-short-patch-repair endonuclease